MPARCHGNKGSSSFPVSPCSISIYRKSTARLPQLKKNLRSILLKQVRPRTEKDDQAEDINMWILSRINTWISYWINTWILSRLLQCDTSLYENCHSHLWPKRCFHIFLLILSLMKCHKIIRYVSHS